MPRPDAPVPASPAGPGRLETLWASAVYAVATLLVGFPALAGRFLVSEYSDQYIAGYAFREFAAASLRAGQGFPLWNPYMFGGMPYVAAMHGDIFYPTFLLRMVMPTDAAMTWGFILHVFLAGLFSYLFLRAQGLGFFGALVGGLAYMLAGNVAALVSPGHDGKLFLTALLPLTLLLLTRGVRDGRAWAWGALAVVIGLAVLSPHPQLLQYLLLVAGAFALFVAFTRGAGDEKLARPIAIRRLAYALGAVLLGGAMGAIQYFPVREYVPWSPRAGGKGWEHAVSYSMPPEELINTYLPQFSGILDNYWGRNGIHLHSEYVGAAVLVLALLSFAGNAAVRRRFVWFWSAVLVVATLWALGGYTPFYRLVYALVPGTKYFRAPSTMLYVVSFAIAVLAAVGAERLLAGRVRPRYAVGWLAFAALVGVLATAGAFTNLALGIAGPQYLPILEANAPAVTLGAWRSFLAVAAVCALALLVSRGRLRPVHAAWALAAVVTLDLWSVLRRYWTFSPPAAQLYAGDAVTQYLQRDTLPGRVVPLAVEQLSGPGRDPYFGSGDGRATGLMVHRIRSAVGYHGNELGRYDQLTGWGANWPQQVTNPNFRRLANIRYLLTNVPEVPLEGMTRVLGPVRNVHGTQEYLFAFPGDNPAAWVATMAVKAADDAVYGTVLDPRFDLRSVALFDTAAAVPSQPVPTQQPAPSDVRASVRSYAPGRITVDLDRPAPANAALVVSENFYPGWTATVDGRPAPIGRADFTLIGVTLPPGARRVELAFTSATYESGKLVTLVALGIAGLLTIAGVVAERRRV